MIDLSNLSCVTICVIGDIILDQFCYGKAIKISQEAPVLVVQSRNEAYALGGAANVALNIKKLGCNVLLCGFVGKDALGRIVTELLNDSGISTDFILPCEETIMKMRIIAEDQHVVRYDREKSLKQQNIIAGCLISSVNNCLKTADGVIFSDYNKGTINQDIISVVQSKSQFVFADPKPINREMFNDLFCITPNLFELQEMFPHIKDTTELLKHVKESMRLKCLLCTMSEHGMIFIDEHNNIHSVGSHSLMTLKKERHHRIDVTGAGDTVISCFAACVLSGIDPILATKISNVAASVVVNKLGTSSCSIDELYNELVMCKLVAPC